MSKRVNKSLIFSDPNLSHSLTTPLVKIEGDDALLTCVVQNQQNLTLMWKKVIKEKVSQETRKEA